MQTLSKKDLLYRSCYFQYQNKRLHFKGSILGGCMRSIPRAPHGVSLSCHINSGKNQSDCTNCHSGTVMKTILILMLINPQKCEVIIPLLKSTSEEYSATCRYCIPITERCLWAVHDNGVTFNRTELSPGTRVIVVEYT